MVDVDRPFPMASALCLLLARTRHEIEKAGDALQTFADDHAEIDTASDRRAVVRTQLPGEADAVLVAVDVAGAAEAEARELRLHPRDHGVDAVVPLAAHQRVEVAPVLGPGAGNQVLSRHWVCLVP